MTPIYEAKIQGQTTADVAVATMAIQIHSDGALHFTDALGHARTVRPTGDHAVLLQEIFTGTDGHTGRWFI